MNLGEAPILRRRLLITNNKTHLFLHLFLLFSSQINSKSEANQNSEPTSDLLPHEFSESKPKAFDNQASEDEESFLPIHYAAFVANAVETGVRDATDLFENIEPTLYKNSKFF